MTARFAADMYRILYANGETVCWPFSSDEQALRTADASTGTAAQIDRIQYDTTAFVLYDRPDQTEDHHAAVSVPLLAVPDLAGSDSADRPVEPVTAPGPVRVEAIGSRAE